MSEINRYVSSAMDSMAYKNVIWHSATDYEFTADEETEQDRLVETAAHNTGRSSYLEYVAKISRGLRDYSPTIKLPTIAANRHSIIRTKRMARAARPAVRQTFVARTAAKAADDGGGSSDPDGRRPHTSKTSKTSKTSINSNTAVSTPVQGGAK